MRSSRISHGSVVGPPVANATSASWDAVPAEPYTPRVTHAYRREQGQWKIVHRHADRPPIDQVPRAEASAG